MDIIDFIQLSTVTDFIKYLNNEEKILDFVYNPNTKKYEDRYVLKSSWYVNVSYMFDLFLELDLSNTVDYTEKIYYLLDNNFEFELEHLNNYKANIFVQTIKTIKNKNFQNYKNEMEVFFNYYLTKNKIQDLMNILEKELSHMELFEKYDVKNFVDNLKEIILWYKSNKKFSHISKSIKKIINL